MKLTKYEKKCEMLSKRLKPMTEAQLRWIWSRLPSFIVAYRRKKYCSECGSEVIDGICQGCGTVFVNKDHYERARHRKVEHRYYYGVETVVGGEQCRRHFVVTKVASPGKEFGIAWFECSRVFVNEKGHTAYQSLDVRPCTYIYDMWVEGSTMKTRRKTRSWYFKERINTDDYAVYPIMRLSDWLRKRGYKGAPKGFSDWSWKTLLAKDPFSEWLCKREHTEWLDTVNLYELRKYKRELELVDKHGYVIEDIRTWVDMVKMFRDFGRDTLNAKYSRPVSLKDGHDAALRLKERKDIEERINEVLGKESLYSEQKGVYVGIVLTDGNFTARVISCAREMVEEGERMHHCVADYIDKPDSLIFTVRDSDGRRAATVEWSIGRKEVVQCRGLQNSVPEGYDDIVKLVKSGRKQIEAARRKQVS